MAISLTQGQAANNGDALHPHALPLERRREQGNDRGLPRDWRFSRQNRIRLLSDIFCAEPPTVRAPVLLAFPPAIV
jgi:hypothetical protein